MVIFIINDFSWIIGQKVPHIHRFFQPSASGTLSSKSCMDSSTRAALPSVRELLVSCRHDICSGAWVVCFPGGRSRGFLGSDEPG